MFVHVFCAFSFFIFCCFLSFCFVYCLFFNEKKKQRKKKQGMQLYRWEGGEDLGGDGQGKTLIRTHSMKFRFKKQ